MNGEIISIDSAALKKSKESLNAEITNVLSRLYNDEFEKGVITFKLEITKEIGKEIYYEGDPKDSYVQKEKTYDKPIFKSIISSTLKLENKTKEEYNEEKRLIKGKEGFMLEDIQNPQVSIDELENEETLYDEDDDGMEDDTLEDTSELEEELEKDFETSIEDDEE